MVNRRNVSVRQRKAKGSFVRQFFIGLLLVLLLALIGSVVWFGSRLEPLTITSIQVEGGETVDRDSIKDLVERELEGDYYRVVPKRFSWTYPEENILKAVSAVKRVKDVALEHPDGQTLIVRFSEYSPAALWCGQGTEGTCAFLDNTGYAFTEAPPLTGGTMLRYRNSEEPKVGERPFSYEFMRDTSFFASVARRDFNLPSFEVEKVGDSEATFYISGGGLLKVSLEGNINDVVDNLRVLLSSEQFQHLNPGNFEYIDLRFGDKLFVNEVGGEADGEVTASSTDEVEE